MSDLIREYLYVNFAARIRDTQEKKSLNCGGKRNVFRCSNLQEVQQIFKDIFVPDTHKKALGYSFFLRLNVLFSTHICALNI